MLRLEGASRAFRLNSLPSRVALWGWKPGACPERALAEAGIQLHREIGPLPAPSEAKVAGQRWGSAAQ